MPDFSQILSSVAEITACTKEDAGQSLVAPVCLFDSSLTHCGCYSLKSNDSGMVRSSLVADLHVSMFGVSLRL